MKEPILKKKSIVDKIFKNQVLLTISTAFLLIFVVVGSSYAIFASRTDPELTDVVVESGNLLAKISSTSETIEMNYTTLGVSDEIGLSYEPYNFTITNYGKNEIAYYELRIVDKEYEISALPHKAINYALSINNSEYSTPKNLGDNHSYIYAGGKLEPNESDSFNLKMWVNEEFGKYANNKDLKASLELTIYSDIPTRNYIVYDAQGGNYVSKTNVSSRRITNQVPVKSGYEFLGWSTSIGGEVEYLVDDLYENSNGITLYAIWKEI